MPAKTILADVCEHKNGGEFYLVDPDVIEIDPTWNARKDFSGEDELVELIKTSGVPVHRGGKEIKLSKREFNILLLLLENSPYTVTEKNCVGNFLPAIKKILMLLKSTFWKYERK